MLLDAEHSVTWRNRCVGFFGPVSSSAMLVWLGSHRGRLRAVLVGGHRLSVLLIWDRQGNARVPERSEEEVEAMAKIVYGPPREQVRDAAV